MKGSEAVSMLYRVLEDVSECSVIGGRIESTECVALCGTWGYESILPSAARRGRIEDSYSTSRDGRGEWTVVTDPGNDGQLR